MKPVLEQKLRELIDESDRQIAPAMSTVLKLMLSAYLKGRHNDFAKHCCKFPPIGLDMNMKVKNEADDSWPDDGSTTYIN